MRRRTLLALVLCLARPGLAVAQDTIDEQFWLQILATLRVSDNSRLHLEAWPRFSENQDGPFQVITRGAVGRRLSPLLTAWGGYAWIAKPPGPGVTHEQRIWQQLSATLPAAAAWTPSLRIRLEQRFQNNWSDASHRLRLMGRGVRPIDGQRRWSIAAWNELLLTLDETAGGPWQGVDQNRVFGGVLHQLSPKAGVEFGYLWVTAEPPAGLRTHAHSVSVWLNLTP
jgi:hypothetical protein